MKIAILSTDATLYSTKRLVEACQQRKCQALVVNTLHACMEVTDTGAQIYYEGKLLDSVNAVIPRIGAGANAVFHVCTLTQQFEAMGVLTLNSAMAIRCARDKLYCAQVLSNNGVKLPITGFSHSSADIIKLLQMVGGAPLIIKFSEGAQGVGVILCETNKTAEATLQAFMKLEQPVIVQEYIAEACGADIRCFVIGDQVVAAMKRQAKEGEFRSNLHRGGSAELIEITEQERATAIKATQLMGLNVAGVDLLRSKRGTLVLEVNSSPGLEGIEKASGKDIAGMMVDYLMARL